MKGALFLLVWSLICWVCHGQQGGIATEEYHLPFPMQSCDSSGCQEEATTIVIDADVRQMYSAADSSVSCQTGQGWDSELCPDGITCAENCALDGIDEAGYQSIYGATSDGETIDFKYLTESSYGTSIGGRLYLLASENEYRLFKMKNREFTIDVDTSQLPCGLNGAVFFVEMEGDGGVSSYPSNSAGAKYGTGYCDAQCPTYLRVIAGEVNIGQSNYGICCGELDIWEANSAAQTYTFHTCTSEGYYPCQGVDCGSDATGDHYNGVCDKDGCEFGAYRMNQHEYYGPDSSFDVDSSQPITVVTQFLTEDGTDEGDLVEMRRLYVQNNQVIRNTRVNFEGIPDYDSITDEFCNDYKELFGEVPDFAAKGGLQSMGEALDRGMVLVLCLWEDYSNHMQWLDGISPADGDPSDPGVLRGPCPADSGRPGQMHQNYPDAYVRYSNVKFGTINSTFTL
uniref:cellulase n=1 Tax=Chelura terebrans TaxID=1336365 RepID=R4V851_9CRUS|nr:family 7 cellobiohydrolase [Chelura terebrans]